MSAFTLFTLTCRGAYPGENIAWRRDGLAPTYVGLVMGDILNFTDFDSHPMNSGQYSCESLDTGDTLSIYNVTFKAGK